MLKESESRDAGSERKIVVCRRALCVCLVVFSASTCVSVCVSVLLKLSFITLAAHVGLFLCVAVNWH